MNKFESVKQWISTKPKNIWRELALLLLFFKYAIPPVLIFLTIFQAGLVAPNVDFTPVYTVAGPAIADTLTTAAFTVGTAGQKIGRDSPLMATFLFYLISAFVWSLWISAAVLIINIIRFVGVSLCEKIKSGAK